MSESFAETLIELDEEEKIEAFLARLRSVSAQPEDLISALVGSATVGALKRLVDIDGRLDSELWLKLSGLGESALRARLEKVADPERRAQFAETLEWLRVRGALEKLAQAPEKPFQPNSAGLAEFESKLGGLSESILGLLQVVRFLEGLPSLPGGLQHQAAKSRAVLFESIFAGAFRAQLELASNADRFAASGLAASMDRLLLVCRRFSAAIRRFRCGEAYVRKFEQYNDRSVIKLAEVVRELAYAQLSKDKKLASDSVRKLPQLLEAANADLPGEAGLPPDQIEALRTRMAPSTPAKPKSQPKKPKTPLPKDLSTIQENPSFFEKLSSDAGSDLDRLARGLSEPELESDGLDLRKF